MAVWISQDQEKWMIAYIVTGILLFMGGISNAQAQTTAGKIVKYHATINDVKYVYGAAEPVARLKSGDILETNTVDAFGNAVQKPGDTLSLVKGDNPLTGPFYIEGAEAGDTLAVKILDLQVDSNQGVGAFAPGFGALNETVYTPMLHTPLPEKIWFYPIDHVTNTATFKALDSNFTVKIPLHPFFGCIGVAPAGGEARSSVVPEAFGGNMDSPEASVGNTIYFPVNVPGALLYMGDGHAAMGDGEVADVKNSGEFRPSRDFAVRVSWDTVADLFGSPPSSDAEDQFIRNGIDAITAAIERLLAGTPLRSSGALDIVTLAEEAGVKRNKLTHKHTDLKDLFYAELADYLGISLDAVEDLTWLDVQAYLEHWKYDPPVQVLVARYCQIPPREVETAPQTLSVVIRR